MNAEQTCPRCHGTGMTRPGAALVDCPVCAGAGKTSAARIALAVKIGTHGQAADDQREAEGWEQP